MSRTPGLAREVQSAAGAGCIVTHHDRVGDLEEFVELKGPFEALVAGPLFDTRAGMERLRRLRAAMPAVPVILALGAPPRTPLPDLVRVGASDLVELPADRRELTAALRRAFTAVAPETEPGRAEEDSPAPGEVISVASPSGGCGKTFYSTNLAWYLASRTGRRVCLVDLDLQFGEVVSALRLKPRWTMVDVVARYDEEGDLDSTIEDYLVPHDDGFWILPAPRHPAEADRIAMPDITRILEVLRRRFDYVVVDTSAQLSEVTLTALELSTSLICMATVDVPSIRNMRVFLDTLQRLNIPAEKVSVILNKVESDIGLKVEEVDQALGGKVVSVLPYAREVSRSINQGRPVMQVAPGADISRRLAAGMAPRLGETTAAAAEPSKPAVTALLRLRRRRVTETAAAPERGPRRLLRNSKRGEVR